jgi:hypothetical protein
MQPNPNFAPSPSVGNASAVGCNDCEDAFHYGRRILGVLLKPMIA